jgi:hypothetical protein
MEKCEKPRSQKRDHIPDNKTRNECGERNDVLPDAHVHVKCVLHKPRTHAGNKCYASETHDVHDRYPCGHDFEKMFRVNHVFPFGFLAFIVERLAMTFMGSRLPRSTSRTMSGSTRFGFYFAKIAQTEGSKATSRPHLDEKLPKGGEHHSRQRYQ